MALLVQLVAGVIVIGIALLARHQLHRLMLRTFLPGSVVQSQAPLRRVARLVLTPHHSIEVVRYKESEFVLSLHGASCTLLQTAVAQDSRAAKEVE